MNLLSNKMTNTQLMAIESVAEAVKEGKVVLIDKVPTSNPDFINLYFFGNVEGLGNSSSVNEAQSMFLGWNKGYQQRCIQNANSEIAMNYEIGTALDNVGIQIFDSVEKSFESQTPRVDREGNTLLYNDQPIYRTTKINMKDAIAKEGHVMLKVTSRVDLEGEVIEESKGVNVDSILNRVTV